MSGNCKSSKTFQKPIEFQYFFLLLLRLLCVGPVIMNIRTIAMNWKYKNPLQSNKSIASCLRQLKTRCNTHTYIHKGIINIPLLASSEDVKPVEVIKSERNCPNPRPIKVFLVQNCLQLIIFSQHRLSKAKTQEGIDIYIFQGKQKPNSENNKILRNPFAEAPFVSVYGASEGLSFEFLLLFWSQNTKDCNEIGMKASEREVLSQMPK